MQLDIFDAIRERDEAMDAIEGVTNKAFTECATEAIKTVGRMRLQFTTDDVWRVIDALPVETKARSAIGPVMVKFEREGVIRKTGILRRSRRAQNHRDKWEWIGA